MVLEHEKAESHHVEHDTGECHDDHRQREKASGAHVRFAALLRCYGHNSGDRCDRPGDDVEKKHRLEDIVCKGASVTDWLVKQER